MTFHSILDPLNSVVSAVPEQVATGLRSDSAIERLRAGMRLRELEIARPLEELLLHDAEHGQAFAASRFFVSCDESTLPHVIAHWLVRRSVEVGADQAITELSKYSASSDFVAREVLVLDGVTVNATTTLREDIELTPIGDLHPSSHQERSMGGGEWSLDRKRVALVRSFSHPIIEVAENEHPPRDLIDLQDHQLLRDFARVMSLLPDVAPATVSRWWEHDPSIPSDNTTSGAGVSSGFQKMFHPKELDSPALAQVKEWMNLLEQVPKELRATLRVVLDRLNASKRRGNTVDRAIELGVAMEALLLRFSGEDRSELSFRLSTRAAWILGTSAESRRETYDLFRMLYDARSRAVHNGALPAKLQNRDVGDSLRRGCEEVAALIIHTLRNPSEDLRYVHLG